VEDQGLIMVFPTSQLLAELERCQLRWAELDLKEHRQLVRQWVTLYGDLYGGGFRKRSGARAIAEAEASICGSFLVVPCRDPSNKGWNAVGCAYRCQGDALPDLTEVSHFVDVFISPDDFTWTLLYGHEVDVFGGPHFTTAEWMAPPPIERFAKGKRNESH
jgi:hypothetical protein